MEILGEGRFLRLIRQRGWEFVQRRGSSGVVGMVAVTAQGKLLLVEQERPPVGGPVLELPAGLVGDQVGQEEEDLAAAAGRELLEETGYAAGRMVLLTQGVSSAGMTDETVHLFRALDLVKVDNGGGDGHEDITVHEVEVARVRAFIRQRVAAGVQLDLKIYAALELLRDEAGQ